MKEYDEKLTNEITPLDSNNNARILRNAYNNSKWFYIALSVGLFLSFINTLVAILILIKFSASVAWYILAFGIFAMITYIFGFWATYKYANLCENEGFMGDNPSTTKVYDSQERTLLDGFLFLVMIIFTIFLILNIGSFAFQAEAQYQVEAISKDKDMWLKYFGDRSYEYITNNLNHYLNVAGTFALGLTIFSGIVLLIAYFILGKYRMMKTLIQFISIVFFIVGLIFMYLGIFAMRYKEFSKVEKAMPVWIPDGLFAISLISILTGITGYIFSKYEMKNFLKFFSLYACALTILVIIFGVFSVIYSSKFDELFDNKCNITLDYMNEYYLIKYPKCDKKYLFQTPTLDNLICPKNRIVKAWEQNIGKPVSEQIDILACLDSQCCLKTYSFIKNNIDYLSLVTFIVFVFSFLLTVGSFFMYRELDKHNLAYSNKYTLIDYILIAFSLIVVVIVIIFIIFIPTTPEPSPLNSIIVDKSNNLDTSFKTQDISSDIEKIADKKKKKNDLQAKEDTSINEVKILCTKEGQCPKIRYSYEMVTKDGKLSVSEDMNKIRVEINNVDEQGQSWLKMTGDGSTLSYYIDKFKFTPKCLLNENRIRLRVSAEAFSYDTLLLQQNIKSFIQISSKQDNQQIINSGQNDEEIVTAAYNLDLSRLRVGDKFQIFDKILDYSIISGVDSVKVIGRVMKSETLFVSAPLKDSKISIKSIDFPDCDPYLAQTDENGNFEYPQINLISQEYTLLFDVDVTYDGLTSFKKTISLGGMGYPKIFDLGQIFLTEPSKVTNTILMGKLINSIDNTSLTDVNIKLFKGYKLFKNKTNNPTPPAFIQISQKDDDYASDLLKQTQPSPEGDFIFSEISSGSYTLLFEKNGFYREFKHIDAMGLSFTPIGTLSMTPLVNEGEIRLVLSWPNAPADLDLHSIFQVSSINKCEVFFTNKRCGGVELENDNKSGGKTGVETITIRELGNYIYTFTVHRYLDISNGESTNENPIPDSPKENYKTDISPIPLSDSNALLSVYANGYSGSVLTTSVPKFENNSDKIKAEDVNWWIVFCLDGSKGLESLRAINELSNNKPSLSYCNEYYKTPINTALIQTKLKHKKKHK